MILSTVNFFDRLDTFDSRTTVWEFMKLFRIKFSCLKTCLKEPFINPFRNYGIKLTIYIVSDIKVSGWHDDSNLINQHNLFKTEEALMNKSWLKDWNYSNHQAKRCKNDVLAKNWYKTRIVWNQNIHQWVELVSRNIEESVHKGRWLLPYSFSASWPPPL